MSKSEYEIVSYKHSDYHEIGDIWLKEKMKQDEVISANTKPYTAKRRRESNKRSFICVAHHFYSTCNNDIMRACLLLLNNVGGTAEDTKRNTRYTNLRLALSEAKETSDKLTPDLKKNIWSLKN